VLNFYLAADVLDVWGLDMLNYCLAGDILAA
jgi:hypothetical protein